MAKTSWRNATIAVRKYKPSVLTHHVPVTYHKPERLRLDGVTWYAVRVRGRVELDGERPRRHSAEADLHRLGLRTYCPLGCRWGATPTQRKVRRQYPVLRPYLFVGMEAASPRFIEVEDLASVSGFLEVAGVKAVIPSMAIEQLNAWELAGEWDETDPERHRRELGERFPIGSTVHVTDGPFASFDASVDAVSEDRIRLLIDIFGRPTRIDVDAGQVEAAG